MRLYLVQHAETKEKEEDPCRPLSKKGLDDIEMMANFLKGKVRVARILHSGKLRAKQTAEKLNESIDATKIEEVDGLSPVDDPRILEKKLMDEAKDVMIIGHCPHLTKGLLLTGDQNRIIIDFEMGGIVCFERCDWVVAMDIDARDRAYK
jgi:phosphohistidine phosphatase